VIFLIKVLYHVYDQPFMTDQACGCEAATGDSTYECDCEMQGACICSHDCKCSCSICKEAVSQL